MIRVIVWLLTHTIYRLRVVGRENFPRSGGALLVSNHMSLVDALLLMGASRRPVRFLIFKDIYDQPYIKPFAKMIRAIPISSQRRNCVHFCRGADYAHRATASLPPGHGTDHERRGEGRSERAGYSGSSGRRGG